MKDPAHAIAYVNHALLGTAKVGTMAWKLIGFPLDKVHIRSKTGSAEVYGKQSTSWVASYDKNYVVLMMVSQAGTGSGTSGPVRPQDLGVAVRRARARRCDTRRRADPGRRRPRRAARRSSRDGSILPPSPVAEGRRSLP